jgi:hypothetical protein
LTEAEKAYYDSGGILLSIGKHLDKNPVDEGACGEFIGLWRMSAAGTYRFRSAFVETDRLLRPENRFQHSVSWKKAYVTDFIQELIEQGDEVKCALFERGWAELDTMQDYGRLNSIAERQRLDTIVSSRMSR